MEDNLFIVKGNDVSCDGSGWDYRGVNQPSYAREPGVQNLSVIY